MSLATAASTRLGRWCEGAVRPMCGQRLLPGLRMRCVCVHLLLTAPPAGCGGSCPGPAAARAHPACRPLLPCPLLSPRPGLHLAGWSAPRTACAELFSPLLTAPSASGSLGRGGPRGLLAPDLCSSWNRQTSAHQTAAVRPRGQPAYLSPVPGEEGGATCHQATPGAPGPPLRPPGSQPSLTSACPGPHPLARLGPCPAGPSAPPPPHPWVLSLPPRTCLQLPA